MTLRREGEYFARGGYGERSSERSSPKKDRKPVLTGEFSGEVNGLVKEYPDTTRLGDLRVPPSSLGRRDYAIFGFIQDCNPPEDWESFYVGLDTSKKRLLSSALDRAMRAGFSTVGTVRKATVEKLTAPKAPGKKHPRISDSMAVFLKKSFDQPGR